MLESLMLTLNVPQGPRSDQSIDAVFTESTGLDDPANQVEVELCHKEATFGDLSFEQFWMDTGSVYRTRQNGFDNRSALLQFFWRTCQQLGEDCESETQQSYILAHLLPDSRVNASRRVFRDASRSPVSMRRRASREEVEQLDGMLWNSREDRRSIVEFRSQVGGILGPPQYDEEDFQAYRRFEAELFEGTGDLLQRDEAAAIRLARDRLRGWVGGFGRHRGHERNKRVLDVISYECRAAMHRVYSHAWEHIVYNLTCNHGLSREAHEFHRWWHLDQIRESSQPADSFFHLFHGHVFALHPAMGTLMLTQAGPMLIGDWLRNPGALELLERFLNGLYIAITNYSLLIDDKRSERRQQPEAMDPDQLEIRHAAAASQGRGHHRGRAPGSDHDD